MLGLGSDKFREKIESMSVQREAPVKLGRPKEFESDPIFSIQSIAVNILKMKFVYFIVLIVSIYLSLCVGSYLTTVNKLSYVNLERLRQVEQSIAIIKFLDEGESEKIKNTLHQTSEIDLFVVRETKEVVSDFTLRSFLLTPWGYWRDKYYLESNEITSSRISQLERELKESVE